ncbi:MAG: adenosyl-hopene transferase HpnH [Candidatus Igneacidithiobacillus chanchocoensis]
MAVPLIQSYRVGRYIIGQKLRGNRKYPLVLMLEPLFRCNLACAGCGKIDYPDDVLDRRLSTEECIGAAEECGAPIVSIAGGEPLIHKEMPEIVDGLIQRKRFVYLCTNALLLKKRMDDYRPSPYLTFSVHLDGNEHRHDDSVCQPGTYRRAAEAIREAVQKGFRVTVNCTLFQGEGAEEVAGFLDDCKEMGVEGVTISPGFNYERAPQQQVFIKRQASRQLFRDIFRIGKERKSKWRFNQSSLFLDFLAGNQTYQCTPWGNPTRNIFGWQKPCYLLVSEGYAASFRELMEETPWDRYGVGNNSKCDQCQVHSGFEPTAVNDTFAHPLKALKVALFGPRTSGPMAPDMPSSPSDSASGRPVFPLRVER